MSRLAQAFAITDTSLFLLHLHGDALVHIWTSLPFLDSKKNVVPDTTSSCLLSEAWRQSRVCTNVCEGNQEMGDTARKKKKKQEIKNERKQTGNPQMDAAQRTLISILLLEFMSK